MKTASKTATLDDLRSWEPCWRDDDPDGFEGRVKKIAGRRKNWKLGHVLALRGRPGLSDTDWQWLVHEFLKFTGRESDLRLAACAYATLQLEAERAAGREPDSRSWEAVRVSWLYAAGKEHNRLLEFMEVYHQSRFYLDAKNADGRVQSDWGPIRGGAIEVDEARVVDFLATETAAEPT